MESVRFQKLQCALTKTSNEHFFCFYIETLQNYFQGTVRMLTLSEQSKQEIV